MNRGRRPHIHGSTLRAALALLSCLLAPVARAIAVDPPRQDSVDALVEDVASADKVARESAPAAAVPPEVLSGIEACDGLAASLSACQPETPCVDALVALYDAFASVAATTSDTLLRRAAARVRTEVGELLPRLGAAFDEVRAGRCGSVAPAGARAARVRLDVDGRTLRVSPLVALRAGRTYALVVDGVSPNVLTALRDSAVPRSEGRRTVLPTGAFEEPLERFLAEKPASIDVAAARALGERAEPGLDALPGSPALAVVQMVLPAVPSGKEMAALRAWFVDGRAVPAATVATVHVVDARAGLLAERAEVPRLSCSETATVVIDPQPLVTIVPQALQTLTKGTYPSLDLRGGVTDEPPRTVALPYHLALPRDAGPDTPVVIVVDGHGGSAVRSLRRHAEGILDRGMALVTVELPEQGDRAAAADASGDDHDPIRINRNIRQGTIDVLAMVHALRNCGLPLPDGRRLRPSRIEYLGYSLGAMVGVAARSVEPALGTMVLVAPGGDFAGWLVLPLVPSLGTQLVTCLGGPEHGSSCLAARTCKAPGNCMIDPDVFWLGEEIRPLYTLLAAGADPLEFATTRTGGASKAPLLLLTGGADVVLNPLLATRLTDAYAMRPSAPNLRRGPRSVRLQFPQLDHDMIRVDDVKRVAYDFLAAGHLSSRARPAAGSGSARVPAR
jgi:hypothetical protein